MIIPFIQIFKTSFKKLFIVDKEVLKQFIIRAIKFGGFAVMAACVLQIEYIVMAKTLDANSITTYNIFSKLFLFVAFVYSSVLTAFWPVSNELFNTGQYLKLKKSLFKYSVLGILLMIIGIFGVYLFKDYVLKILAPNLNITVGLIFFILFIIYYILRIISDTYAMFLQSVNSLKIFWIYTPFQAVISISAQYFLSSKYGLYGIIFGLIISFILTSAWICPYKSYKIFKSVEQK
jgi:O-antigen/teichoic acid export membrane protein